MITYYIYILYTVYDNLGYISILGNKVFFNQAKVYSALKQLPFKKFPLISLHF